MRRDALRASADYRKIQNYYKFFGFDSEIIIRFLENIVSRNIFVQNIWYDIQTIAIENTGLCRHKESDNTYWRSTGW